MKKSKNNKSSRKDSELIKEMAKEVAEMIKYIELDAPSETYYQRMDNIIDSFECKKRKDFLQRKLDKMPYRKVIKLEEKVNELLTTGKYD